MKDKGTVAGSSKPMRDYMRGRISSSEYFRAVRSVTGSGAPTPTIKRTGSGSDNQTPPSGS